MAETGKSKSKREMLGERLKSKYPDKEYADDEELFGQVNDDYDEYEKKIGDSQAREGKLVDMFNRDPRSAQFITDLAKGKDPLAGFINLIGIDGLKEMLNDPKKIEEFSAENKQYEERVAKQRDLEAQWQKNMQQTLSMLEQKQQEMGLSDEQIDQAADWIKEVTNDAVLGVIKPETLDMALKAINHDADVQSAGEAGEVRGRNAKIEAGLRKPQNDGTVVLGGANTSPGPKAKSNSLFELADQAR